MYKFSALNVKQTDLDDMFGTGKKTKKSKSNGAASTNGMAAAGKAKANGTAAPPKSKKTAPEKKTGSADTVSSSLEFVL